MARRAEHDPRPDLAELGLLDFIPAVSGGTRVSPHHFRAFVEVFERARKGNLRCVLSGPVQHGKSELTKHAIPWWHMRDPSLSIFYATYAQQFTELHSRDIRRLTEEAGCRFREDHKRLDGWSFEAGGRAVMTSVEGPGTGLPGDIVIVDDPFKGPLEAYSRARRNLVHEWYKGVLTVRQSPAASYFVIASRWDEDDLSGRLIKEGYDEIRLPAICDSLADPNGRPIGQALCPWGPDPNKPRDLAFLMSIRDGVGKRVGLTKHMWDALYQGRPSPQERCLFAGGPWTYEPAEIA